MKYYVLVEGAAEFTINNVNHIDVRDESYFVYDEEGNVIFTSPQAKTSYIVLALD